MRLDSAERGMDLSGAVMMGRLDTRDSATRVRFAKRADSLSCLSRTAIYLHARKRLSCVYSDDTASHMAMCISDYVFTFDKTAAIADVRRGFTRDDLERNLDDVLRTFSTEFKTDCTGALILLAAARQVDLPAFVRHMKDLADRGFVQVGRNAPNVAPALLKEDRRYLHEVAALAPRRPALPAALAAEARHPRRRLAVLWGH